MTIEKRPIVFLLNGIEQSVMPERADMTLLNWLRQDRKMTGSKEGCAEGDCGACSVVMARRNADGSINHQAANACILFLPMLDGLSITTVEHIASDEGALHPVQEALVQHHGSQCGFCTPGFVLSLFAGWRSGLEWTRQNIEDLLAGNLCRCTGYGPIINAAMSLEKYKMPAWDQARIDAEASWLNTHHIRALATAEKQPFIAPVTRDELSQSIADHPEYQIIAGATDIGLWVTKQFRKLDGFISVMRVPELSAVTETDDHFVIPAGVTHHQAQHALASDFPALDELWRRFGSTQVRANGTVCGNIANGSPIGDLSPAFLALGATLTLQHRDQIRDLPIENFFLDYQKQDRKKSEWLAAITIPKLTEDASLTCLKISRRFDQDISAVMGAFWFDIKDGKIIAARIGFGGMAAIPARARATENALINHDISAPVTDEIIKALSQDFSPITDVRASHDYRQYMARNLLIKAITASQNPDQGMPTLAGSNQAVLPIEDVMPLSKEASL